MIISRVAILSFFMLCIQAMAYGQKNVYPANTTDQVCSPALTAATVNCDMIETPQHDGRLFAISWDDNSGAYVKVFHNSEVYQNVTITLPGGATQPDVALANDMDATADFKVAVAYTVNTDVFLGIYAIAGIGALSMQATEISTIKLNSHNAAHPHVDMFADKATLISGLPSLHRFGVAWDEWDATVNDISVNARAADISKPAEWLWNVYVPEAVNPDIAAYTDDNNGKQYLSVLYVKNKSVEGTGKDLRVLETELDGFTNQFYFLEKGADIATARIEAQSFHYAGAPKWAAVAAVGAATPGQYDIKIYDNDQHTSGISAPLANQLDNGNPAIAAGTGKTGAGGTNLYSVAFYPMYDTSLYVTSAPQWTASWPGSYWEANSKDMDVHSGMPAVAISSSSNSGTGQLAAWYNGHEIAYALTDDERNNNQAPTSVKADTHSTVVSLYPNPAANTLYVRGAHHTDKYAVTDVTGRSIIGGSFTDASFIDVSSLLPGSYILSLQGKETVTELRFTKL